MTHIFKLCLCLLRPFDLFNGYTESVSRFGEISPLRQNFNKLLAILSNFLVFEKIANLLWQIFYSFGQIFIALKGQILK